MPEKINNQPPEESTQNQELASEGLADIEAEELQKKFEERMGEIPDRMGKMFDEAEREKKSPIDTMLGNEIRFEELKDIFGEEKIEELKRQLRSLEITSRDDFIKGMREILEPFIYERFFDPEKRIKMDKLEGGDQLESLRFSGLEATVKLSNWDFLLEDNTKVSTEDKILEISWPEESKSFGLQAIKSSMREIADLLKARTDIKAITGVSWMMSRNITKSLGFEILQDVDIGSERAGEIAIIATKARRDKGYKKGVNDTDVAVGAISREKFIEKYG